MSDGSRDLVIGSIGQFELAMRTLWSHRCIFRGEDSTAYALRPRVGRFERAESAVETGRGLLEEFKRMARPLLASAPTDDWEWLALAHRHGLATRFLDWTSNPLLAVFWAVQEPYRRGDRVLYVLDRSALPEGPVPEVSPFDVAVATLYQPTRAGQRLASDSGVLTLHPDPTAAYHSEALERWVIEEAALTCLCLTVDGLGTEDETFAHADLDFVCRKLNWDLEVEILADATARAR